MLFSASISKAAYVPLPVTTGFNADVIANGIGTGLTTTSIDVDGVNYAFAAQGWQATSSTTPLAWGLPTSGIINSAVVATNGLSYTLASYSSNNALRIATNGSSGTLTFGYTPKAKTVYVLATSGSGISYFTGQINFTDNTSQAITTSIVIPDWFNGTTQPTALGGFGRIDRTTDATEPDATNPRLYQIEIPITAANQTKQIASFEFTKASTSATGAVINIFAVSADIISTNDAGVSALVSPINFCPGNRDVKVKVKNYGNNVINNVQVNWSLNGTPQTVFNLTLPLDTIGGTGLNEREVLLGSYNFTTAAVAFKSWTSLPNSVADTFNFNDTLNRNLQAALSGTYTINSAVTTGGNNYQTFTEFANALGQYGVCGPVVANVTAGSGPYVETVTFGNIAGASETNKIRINGNGATVQFTNTTATRQLLTLNGTKYLSIDSLTFKSLATDFGWGALITGGSYKDSITNCIFDLSSLTTTTSANASGIAFSASNTSSITAGNNGSKCYIANNRIVSTTGSGGTYYTLTLAGACDSNIITNNKLENQYMYGIYLTGGTANQILNNEIHRSTKTAVTTFYGIYTTGAMPGTVIMNNKIHTPGGTVAVTTSSAYGYYFLGDGTATDPIIAANNIYYNINQGGTIYGFYLSAALYNYVYHNTIVIDKILTGTSTNAGLYATGTNTGSKFNNNIVSITAGTLGTKYGFYYSAAASIADAQKNNFYVNSTQSGTQNYGYYTTAQATQTAFQTAYPALEIGSLTVNPQFVNAATGNLLPTNMLLNANGVNLGSSVLYDILGNLRQSLPTPGAFELASVAGPNAGLIALINPVGIFCAGQQAVKVSVINSGTNQLSNFQIHWTVNNVAQPSYTYSAVLDTFGGAGQFMDTVTIGTANIPSGNNTIKAWVAIAGDVSTLNDTLSGIVAPSIFTIASASDTVCLGADGILTLSPSTGYAAGTIQWQISTNGSVFTDITNANSPNWTQTNMTANRWFRTFINSGTIGCHSDTMQITVVDPQILTTTPGARCGTGTVSLAASASSGSTISWYNVPTGGTEISSGTTLTTPSISTTTTYYAEAKTGGGIENMPSPTIGTAEYINSTAGWGLRFTATNNVKIESVTIKARSTSPTSSIQINITDLSDVVVYSGVVHNLSLTSSLAEYVIPVMINVAPGDYKMVMTHSGITTLVRESSGVSFPYTSLNGAISITAGANGANLAQTTSSYYWFYNWVISTGCSSTRTPVVATVNPAPTVSGTGASRCGTGTVTLTASSTTSGATFNWYTTPTGGTPVFTGASFTTPSLTTTTTYYVTAGTTGCESDRSPVIATINTTPTTTGTGASRCGTGTVTLTAGSSTTGTVFNWYAAAIGGTALFTGASFTTPSIATTTTYYVDGTVGTCTGARVPVIATVNANPTVSLGNDTSFCIGNSVILTATSTATTFLWDNASTIATRTVNAAGTYSVQVTDANNCIGHDTVVVTENALPVVNLGNDTAICDGDAVVLDAGNAGSTYAWDNAATTQTTTITTDGTYSVSVTDGNGCNGHDTIIVTTIPPPSGSIGITTSGAGVYNFSITNPQGVLGNKWNFGDQSAESTNSNVTHTYTANGDYIVTLTLYGQCDTVILTDTINEKGLHIGNIKVDDKALLLYPNPTQNNVTIENKLNYILKEIVVYNVLGQVLLQEKAQSDNKHELNVNHLPAGLYNIKIVTDKGNVIRKLELIK